jgi:Spy/CpxP family protein refolding chaperone
LQHTPSSRKERLARLTEVLSLSDAQAQQVDQIFEESSRKVSDLQKQIDPEFQAIHMETRARIRQILNPDQQKKFDEFLRGIDARRKRRGPPPPPPR